MFSKTKTFLQESKQELKKVNWPTRAETVRYTLFVIVFSLVIAAYLGAIDFGFVQLLEKLVLKV